MSSNFSSVGHVNRLHELPLMRQIKNVLETEAGVRAKCYFRFQFSNILRQMVWSTKIFPTGNAVLQLDTKIESLSVLP